MSFCHIKNQDIEYYNVTKHPLSERNLSFLYRKTGTGKRYHTLEAKLISKNYLLLHQSRVTLMLSRFCRNRTALSPPSTWVLLTRIVIASNTLRERDRDNSASSRSFIHNSAIFYPRNIPF